MNESTVHTTNSVDKVPNEIYLLDPYTVLMLGLLVICVVVFICLISCLLYVERRRKLSRGSGSTRVLPCDSGVARGLPRDEV